MAYIITSNCDNCKYSDCVEVCPVDAFHEGPTMLYINPDTCIDCNACVAECPVNAIYSEQELPEKWMNYTEINYKNSKLYPVITQKKSPLPTAKSLKELESN